VREDLRLVRLSWYRDVAMACLLGSPKLGTAAPEVLRERSRCDPIP
jgi:hypothetical protein